MFRSRSSWKLRKERETKVTNDNAPMLFRVNLLETEILPQCIDQYFFVLSKDYFTLILIFFPNVTLVFRYPLNVSGILMYQINGFAEWTFCLKAILQYSDGGRGCYGFLVKQIFKMWYMVFQCYIDQICHTYSYTRRVMAPGQPLAILLGWNA